MAMETARERAGLAGFSGEFANVGAVTVSGHYEEPQAEDQLVEGTAPTFLTARGFLEAASITIGTTIDSIQTQDGRTVGPFKVVRWQVVEDGAFVNLALQQT